MRCTDVWIRRRFTDPEPRTLPVCCTVVSLGPKEDHVVSSFVRAAKAGAVNWLTLECRGGIFFVFDFVYIFSWFWGLSDIVWRKTTFKNVRSFLSNGITYIQICVYLYVSYNVRPNIITRRLFIILCTQCRPHSTASCVARSSTVSLNGSELELYVSARESFKQVGENYYLKPG